MKTNLKKESFGARITSDTKNIINKSGLTSTQAVGIIESDLNGGCTRSTEFLQNQRRVLIEDLIEIEKIRDDLREHCAELKNMMDLLREEINEDEKELGLQ
ncbi:hypothetical protein [Methanosphaera cuniculi]|uniref:Uncharacterized protein n=1 Tax=Methanosphaera cuniculi TaxID=1077256 RepID=A0A2A2HDZ0_9EURY|nr:hypothetical protein [Methanosphaera cuniculi]PAV07540.1 hypothetical protein ASJ82_07640 [Methanosphaera cuniculi]PWL08144.1 hypothetical protein MSCUN_10750 [Methanosphaera cuniculi]